jgi:endonuclease/exonuclease/phosphatase family metal-dependent hydrolase
MKRRLSDSFNSGGSGFGVTYAGQLPFLRIDYVMHDDHFKTEGYRKYKITCSDHYPVAAYLSPIQ